MNRNKDKFKDEIIPISIVDNFDYIFFTEDEYKAIRNEMKHYESAQAVVIEALKIVQKRHGWVMDNAIIAIASILGMSITEVESIATFYNQIFRQPVGRHIVRFCNSIVCYITGSKDIKITFERILNVRQGGTTLDNRFTLIPACCLGKCDESPIIMIDEDMYVRVSSTNLLRILEKYL